MRPQTALSLLAVGVLTAACGGPLVGQVADSTYHALVPTTEQLASDSAADLPGGFTPLQVSGVHEIWVVVDGDEVTIRLDGNETVTRQVTERLLVQDSEGSGPLKGEKEVLVLGAEPLVLGNLTIEEPVVWPGSFEDSPVITLKSRNDQDRGPGVSCTTSEHCLLLTSGVDPVGAYEDANNPSLNENPIATIEVLSTTVTLTLDSGEVVEMSRDGESTTNACGLSTALVWNLPDAVGLAIDDPVLIQASCPTTPGDNYLVIMGRSDIPVLAPLGSEFGGEWCQPGGNCLLFVPTG